MHVVSCSTKDEATFLGKHLSAEFDLTFEIKYDKSETGDWWWYIRTECEYEMRSRLWRYVDGFYAGMRFQSQQNQKNALTS